MILVRWDPVMLLGIDGVDDDHRALVAALEAIDRQISDNDLAAAKRSFDALVVLARRHFGEEETLMRASGFSGFVQHKLEHDDFADHLDRFQRQFGRGGIALHEDMMRFVGLWFLGHILGTDRLMAGHIGHGSRRAA